MNTRLASMCGGPAGVGAVNAAHSAIQQAFLPFEKKTDKNQVRWALVLKIMPSIFTITLLRD